MISLVSTPIVPTYFGSDACSQKSRISVYSRSIFGVVLWYAEDADGPRLYVCQEIGVRDDVPRKPRL